MRRFLFSVLLVAIGFAAGWFSHRSPPRREAPAVAELPERLTVEYPVDGFPSRRTVTLRIDRVTNAAGEVVFDRVLIRHEDTPPAWKLTASGYTYFAVPVPE
jgi:hypothetical protein